jgi:hypothetical protein
MSQKIVAGLSAMLIGTIMSYEGLKQFSSNSQRLYENYNSRAEIKLMQRMELGEQVEQQRKINIMFHEYEKLEGEFKGSLILLFSGLVLGAIGSSCAGLKSNLVNYLD